MTTKFKGPFVNLNGSSRKSLIKYAFNVSGAAESLIQALGVAAPHGRDYQTVGGDAFKHDCQVWDTYLQQVRDIFEEYRGVGERLFLEGEERKRK